MGAAAGWSHPAGPFHRGEIQAQERVGVAAKMAGVGRQVIRRTMPDQHRAFSAKLPFALVGAIDAEGQPWASVLAGAPGFLFSPEPDLLSIAQMPGHDDPLAPVWRAGKDVGLLGIEWPSRRRNRVNGKLERGTGDILLRVEQSFGNCPRYIQTRDLHWVEAEPRPAERRVALSEADRALIEAADTFFIASASGGEQGRSGGADVSHRGGRPGFVRIDDDGKLPLSRKPMTLSVPIRNAWIALRPISWWATAAPGTPRSFRWSTCPTPKAHSGLDPWKQNVATVIFERT